MLSDTTYHLVIKWFLMEDQLHNFTTIVIMIIEVSHTTDDLVFEWFPVEDQPLVVEPLQLPQGTFLVSYLLMRMMMRRI